MTTRAYEHALGAGETLVVDVSVCATPFGWTATSPDWTGTAVMYDGSISGAAGDWIVPARNAEITGDVSDYELDPIRFMRFRHTAGAGAVTIRLGVQGRVGFEVSS